jgi:YD repeat-containing protein
VYDSATVDGVVMTNTAARLAEAYTATCGSCTKVTDLGFSYDVLGNATAVYQLSSHSSTYFVTTATYYMANLLESVTADGVTLTYSLDGEGRLSSIASSAGQSPVVSSVEYNSGSRVTKITYGSGDWDVLTTDPNLGFVTGYTYNVGTSEIKNPLNSNNQQTCTYTHDDLTRLATDNCGSAFSQTFSYDRYGNISIAGFNPFQPTYNSANNRFSAIGTVTPTTRHHGAGLTMVGLYSSCKAPQGVPTPVRKS